MTDKVQPVVRISDDALALACGADEVAAAFAAAGCTVERVSSWGMHWLEPLADIDGQGFGPLEPGDVAAVLDGSSAKGIGAIAEHPFIARQQRFTFARAGKTRPLSLADYTATGGWAGLARARELGPEATIAEVTQSGLRGRGGAGFPAGIKWSTVAKAAGSTKYIVCNADEGDSGTFADRMVMEGDPFMLIEGLAIAAVAVGAGKGYVYIRSEYPHAIAKMQAAAELAAPLIAPFAVEIRVGAGAYVCGEETSLLNSLEGKRGEVRAKPPLPALEGLFGQPTVVNNVLTLAAVPWILANGAKAYADVGFGRSRGTMPIQISGNVRYGGLFEVGFGITLGELVNDIGGGTASGRPVRAVQVGGPLGAYHPPADYGLNFDYEAFAEAEGLIGHAGLTVFDDSADMSALARFAMNFCAAESCGKCTPCRIGSTRGVELIDRIRARRGSDFARSADKVEALPQMHNARKGARSLAEEITLLEDLCETMKFGSLCALGGFTPYPVLSALRHFPEDFGAVVPVQDAAE
ncbi:NADH-ubiquinone oxidoreductase-F iron-sulfur binding region domain-containing protein [Novosphingobium sp.]|uniref:NADH-ubiquinone oxidoreductase-F iron-sulfur binding region domain-containing protein n=1 Tax=Novosphingobium sp. TaxID=1874826 RepID=UPI0038BCD587